MLKNKLKEIRMKEFMMTQKEFADFLEFNYTSYNQIEANKKSVSLENAYDIAKKLNRNIEDIWFK